MNIIGRISEIESLTRLCNSSRSEFLMVYGRRRVGKTFLIREFFNNRFAFSVTGIARGNRKEQLTNFYVSISRYNENVGSKIPEDWFEAFHLLE